MICNWRKHDRAKWSWFKVKKSKQRSKQRLTFCSLWEIGCSHWIHNSKEINAINAEMKSWDILVFFIQGSKRSIWMIARSGFQNSNISSLQHSNSCFWNSWDNYGEQWKEEKGKSGISESWLWDNNFQALFVFICVTK